MNRLILLLCLFLVSCMCEPKVQVVEKEVFVRCPISVQDVPKTEKPKFLGNETYVEKLKIIIEYLFRLEHERDTLRNVLEACSDEGLGK